MKRLILSMACATAVAAIAGQEYPELPQKIFSETEAQKTARLAWWTNDRFGMFIHFGLYAMPARHEWVRCQEYIPNETYDRKYFPRFNPDLFDAREWARKAKAAGMKYVVLTTKHHEGFCMFDSALTDYKITKTPFGRDLVREYVDALRAEGLKVGFYYSLIDWHHPDFTVDRTHPLRPRDGFTAEKFEKLNRGRDMAKYREYLFGQVRELLTNYGKIDIIWFDFTCKVPKNQAYAGKTYRDWNAVELIKMARKLQPGILVDNRLDLMDTDDGWDFVTPEQFKAQNWPTIRGKRVPWETCQTFSGSWGYYRDETTWKNMPQLLELLIETVSKGGNLIMNVGPTARGDFDSRANARLDGFAKWMHHNARSIYGCGVAPDEFKVPQGTMLTYNAAKKLLYVHLIDYPMGLLPVAFFDKIDYAQFLHDGSELKLRRPPKRHGQSGEQEGEMGGIILPILKPEIEIPVIEIFLK